MCVCVVSPACLYVFLVGSLVDQKFLLFYVNLVVVILYFIAKQKESTLIHWLNDLPAAPCACLEGCLGPSAGVGWLPCIIVTISGLFGQCILRRLAGRYLYEDGGGPSGRLWFVALRSGFLCALQFPRSSTSPRGCSGGDRFYACA